MTHDELLAAIDKIYLDGFDGALIDTLRAVVKLHKPIQDKKLWCEGCRVEDDDWYSTEYPCPTIHTIERVLNLG